MTPLKSVHSDCNLIFLSFLRGRKPTERENVGDLQSQAAQKGNRWPIPIVRPNDNIIRSKK